NFEARPLGALQDDGWHYQLTRSHRHDKGFGFNSAQCGPQVATSVAANVAALPFPRHTQQIVRVPRGNLVPTPRCGWKAEGWLCAGTNDAATARPVSQGSGRSFPARALRAKGTPVSSLATDLRKEERKS